jgi:hypothetical protein
MDIFENFVLQERLISRTLSSDLWSRIVRLSFTGVSEERKFSVFVVSLQFSRQRK